MKRDFRKYLAIAALLLLFTACKKELETYDSGPGLNIYTTATSRNAVDYSFVYGPKTATTDTIWIKLETMGDLSEKDREVSFERLMDTSATNAVAGVHYVPFDDPSVKSKFVIRAGKAIDSVPVIIKRDPSLKTDRVVLWLQIKANESFKSNIPNRSQFRLTITDQLAKPANWAQYFTSIMGAYGPVKHQFMIDETGLKFDEPHLTSIGFTPTGLNANRDDIYGYYLRDRFKKAIILHNQQRAAQGLGPLAEADGRLVTF